jgi:CRP/FNR family transcriptional regulator, cyclic AMP receptor protein
VSSAADELKGVPLFADLSGRQLKKLASHAHERTLEPGTSVVQEGTMSGAGFFVVVEGEAVVNVEGAEVARLGPGDHFGELAAITERERAATVTTLTRVRCLEIPLWDFRDFARANGDFTWKLLQHVVDLLRPGTSD